MVYASRCSNVAVIRIVVDVYIYLPYEATRMYKMREGWAVKANPE